MGLFGRNKNRREQLADHYDALARQQLAQAGVDPALAMSPGGMEAMMAQAAEGQAFAAKAQRLHAAGVDTPARLDVLQPLGPPSAYGTEHDVTLTVMPPGAAPYPVTFRQSLHPMTLEGLAPGSAVTARVDPADPGSVLLYGAAGSTPATVAGATTSGADPLDELARLGELHRKGLVSDQQFEAEKARLLAL